MTSVSCIRCGVCCKKGGPCLHTEDLALLHAQGILISDLVCLRKGEIVSDPRAGKYVELAEERLKIRGANPGWVCIHYQEQDLGCGIYASRPLECRELTCSDPASIYAAMEQPYLVRSDLLSTASGLWECVQEHERLFPVVRAIRDAKSLTPGSPISQKLHEYIMAERHFRDVLCERLQVADEMLYPYLGRPLSLVIAPFGHFRTHVCES